ncbi:MAG: hypothetical protein JEZ11_00180 [Desulfobacterales bacterium]|nr:hypothetical protein [Desulfobacterales bacterium]
MALTVPNHNPKPRSAPRRDARRLRPAGAGLMAFLLFLLTALPVGADVVEVPGPVSNGLWQFIGLLADDDNPAGLPEMLGPVIDFVMTDKASSKLYTAERHFDAPSAYHQFDVSVGLSRILRFAFNPNIPSALSSPATVRWSRWVPLSADEQDLARLATATLPVRKPLAVRVLEQIENTPDMTSGAYHRYALNRLLGLYSVDGRNILVSASKQLRPSEVGKKGLIVGTDTDWTYLYSEEKGLSVTGLGWVRSQIYSNYTVSVYVEAGGRVRCATFQWMRAGWSGINMVRRSHLVDGLKRYAESFKTVIEHPRLPRADRMEATCSLIHRLPRATLKAWFQAYLAELEGRPESLRDNVKKWIAKYIGPGFFQDDADGQRMEARLALEWLKQAMGRAGQNSLGSLAEALGTSG